MPPPDPKIRPRIHPLHHLPRPPALDPETHHRHPERSIPIPFPKNRHIVPTVQEIEQDPLQVFFMRRDGRPRFLARRGVGPEVGKESGDRADEFVARGRETQFDGQGIGRSVEIVAERFDGCLGGG